MAATIGGLIVQTPVGLAGQTTRVSVGSDGTKGNLASIGEQISADGRYVAFGSDADNLVPGDANGVTDVFVRDLEAGTTVRVSVTSTGGEANGESGGVALSADGRYVAFHSLASNLVAGDTNEVTDVFVHDRETGATRRVSIASDGTEGNVGSVFPSVSLDGRVLFESLATNLVPGDTNRVRDVFVHDLATGATTRVSEGAAGTQTSGASFCGGLSADGRFAAMRSDAPDLIPGDTNDTSDVFVRDLQTGAVERVSVATAGTQADGPSEFPQLSPGGRVVVFHSLASNLVAGDTNGFADVFLHDRVEHVTVRVSSGRAGTEANSSSFNAHASADGFFVVFVSHASNLVDSDTNGTADVFVHDRHSGSIERVNVGAAGGQAKEGGGWENFGGPSVSANGRLVAFANAAGNLVRGDRNGVYDVFVRAVRLASAANLDLVVGDGACGSDALGASIVSPLQQARDLVREAAPRSSKSARSLLARAKRALRKAKSAVRRSGPLSAGCDSALEDALRSALSTL